MEADVLLAKLGRRWFRRHTSSADQLFVRDTFRHWCPARELPNWTVEGFQMLASPRDYTSYDIYFFGVYDPLMTTVLKTHIPEGATCWDIGTERGWFSLLMGRLVGPDGRVDGFEAFPPNYDKLVANIALNQYSWVHPHHVAVSSSSGRMNFVPPSDAVTDNAAFLRDCGGVGYLTTQPEPGSIEVPAIQLDEYAEEIGINHLDFVKLDIEGAEVAALHGAERTLRKYRPKIAVEYNRKTAKRAGTSLEELDDLLECLGYDRFTFDGRLQRLRLDRWSDRPDIETVFNVYCFPRERRTFL